MVKMDTTQRASGGETPAGWGQWEQGLSCYLFDWPAFKKTQVKPQNFNAKVGI